MNRRQFLSLSFFAATLPLWGKVAFAQSKKTQQAVDLLLARARAQIGTTLFYDSAYTKLAFPMGDVPRAKGVCTDVIIRAYRDAFAFDLQKAVHKDMRDHFAAYPNNWGLKRPDANIDHRRVPNLRAYFARQKAALPVSQNAADYQAGDMVTQLIDKRLPHIALVSNKQSFGTPLVIHNIGYGTREENYLFRLPITGHYRFFPDFSH